MKKTQAIILLILIFVSSIGIGIAGSWGFSQIRVVEEDTPVIVETSTNISNKEKANKEKEVREIPSRKENLPQDKPNHFEETDVVVISEEEPLSDNIPDNILNEDNKLDLSTDVGIDMSREIQIVIGEPNPNSETRTYAFSASAEGGYGRLTYYLYPAKNAKDTLVSEDGHFINVSSCPNGKYILHVKDAYGNESKQEVTGFISILKKLTPQELTSRLSKATPDNSLKNYFPQGRYSITFAGIKSGDPIPTTYTQIYSNIASGYWSKVRVTNIEYNDYNKITRVYISVYYN